MEKEEIMAYIDDQGVSKLLEAFFDPQWIEAQAKQSKFIERGSSRLTGFMFLLMNALELGKDPNYSLQAQCNWFNDTFILICESNH